MYVLPRKNPLKKYKAPLKAFNVGAPFERIALDILVPFPEQSKDTNTYLSLEIILVNG